MAQVAKNPPAVRETWVQSLGWEDPLEKGKAAHSSILAWRIPWTSHKELDMTEQLSLFTLGKKEIPSQDLMSDFFLFVFLNSFIELKITYVKFTHMYSLRASSNHHRIQFYFILFLFF